MPASNRVYWLNKIDRNVKRDKQTRKALKKSGWNVIQIWEHDLKNRPVKAVNSVIRATSQAADDSGETAKQLAIAKKGMAKYRNTLAALAS
jgi:G:T-mismatch repair DNA endonuclease (very short patch repair protein)